MTDMTVAKTIIEQLGGMGKLVTMCGAKNFGAGDNFVVFRLPARFAKNGINSIRITLNSMDLYDVVFLKFWGTKMTEMAKHEGVYCDMLQQVFEDETGLCLSLGRRT